MIHNIKTQFDKHRSEILLYLLSTGKVNKSSLIPIVSSPPVLNDVLKKMEGDKLIQMNELRIGRRSFEIFLTERGNEVAVHLYVAQLITEGADPNKIFMDKFDLLIALAHGDKEKMKLSSKMLFANKFIKSLTKLNLLIEQLDGSLSLNEENIGLTEKGKEIARKLQEINEILKKE
jgi:DNA-binding MarR family transcriptional regulator